MSVPAAAFTFSTQKKMHENIFSLDYALSTVAKAKYKQKTSSCLDTSHNRGRITRHHALPVTRTFYHVLPTWLPDRPSCSLL